MKRKKKITIGIGLLLVGILFWQFGFFTRFNYLTAQLDIWKDKPRLVSCEFENLKPGVRKIKLNRKYGFYRTNEACFVNQTELNGIKIYNAEIERYLNKRNGKNWREKYEAELDSLIKINRVE